MEKELRGVISLDTNNGFSIPSSFGDTHGLKNGVQLIFSTSGNMDESPNRRTQFPHILILSEDHSSSGLRDLISTYVPRGCNYSKKVQSILRGQHEIHINKLRIYLPESLVTSMIRLATRTTAILLPGQGIDLQLTTKTRVKSETSINTNNDLGRIS